LRKEGEGLNTPLTNHQIMSSSLRNAVKRKTHKERAQPSGRKRLGLLEKKQDYKLRADDYAFKRKRIEALRRKAELRNEDEFYFGMVNTRTRNGVHDHQAEDLTASVSQDALKLIRTQNRAYLETTLKRERRKMERMREGLHFIGTDGGGESTHTIFVDDKQDDLAELLNTVPELVHAAPHNRLTKDQLRTLDLTTTTNKTTTTDKAYGQLEQQMKRVDVLKSSLDHVDLKRKLMGKGRRVKVKEGEGDAPPVFRWHNERKR
jgi:U3 small nucleolar RNA-associated protein 11